MSRMPNERKPAMLIKILAPDAPSIVSLSKQEDISEATLYKGVKNYVRKDALCPHPTAIASNELLKPGSPSS